MKALIHTLPFFLVFIFQPLNGQNLKKIYDSGLDSIWSNELYIDLMSPNGNWVTFTEFYQHRESMLHLINSENIHYTFRERLWDAFSNDSQWYGNLSKSNSLTVINLESGKDIQFDSVKNAAFSPSGKFIVFTRLGEKKQLEVLDLATLHLQQIENIEDFYWSPVHDRLVIQINDHGNFKLRIQSAEKREFEDLPAVSLQPFKGLRWSADGSSVVFLGKGPEGTAVYHYSEGNLRSIDDQRIGAIFPGYIVQDEELLISRDGENVFFNRKSAENYPQDSGIEEWDTDDPWEYPRLFSVRTSGMLSCWQMRKDKIQTIETEAYPSSFLDPDLGFAVVYNPWTYEPLYNEHFYADLQLKDLVSGSLEPVASKVYVDRYQISISPQGNFIVYFKDSEWWLYHTQNKQTMNLDQLTGINFKNRDYDYTGEVPPIEPVVWEENDRYLILHDSFDLYKIDLKHFTATKITSGKEQNRKYRVQRSSFGKGGKKIKFLKGYFSYQVAQNDTLLLSISDATHNTGLATWDGKSKVTDIAFEARSINSGILSPKSGIFFKKERYNEPPTICFSDLRKKQKLLYQSNSELLNYDLGSARMIKYKSQSGKELQGSLFYPAGFDPQKQYPMIVNIYEHLSNQVNNFSPPSMFEGNGFNILKYLTEGYFVLYPDFEYQYAAPGISAVKSVTAAVEKAMENPSIKPGHIGLIGHSFGGYEAAFIATQTELFAAVVAGAAPTNLVSWYHTMGWYWGKSEMWRFENGQFRMGRPFFENKEAFYSNSPFHQVEHLKTPLLLWSGKIDYQVFWHQSIEMYLSMIRQKKEGKMLLYENEGHLLLKKENQFHLNQSILNWFKHYLK